MKGSVEDFPSLEVLVLLVGDVSLLGEVLDSGVVFSSLDGDVPDEGVGDGVVAGVVVLGVVEGVVGVVGVVVGVVGGVGVVWL